MERLAAIAGDYVTPKQAAEILGVNAVTVRMWCRKGTIERRRIGKRWEIPKRAIIRRMQTLLPTPWSQQEYLSIRKAAKVLNMNEHTLRSWVKKGQVPVRKMGRNYQLSRRTIQNLMMALQERYMVDGSPGLDGWWRD
jgi:excisionase family DNA binding protein